MNNRVATGLAVLLCAGFLLAVSSFVRAGDSGNFKTVVIASGGSDFSLHIADKHFVRFRNFTQSGTATDRGAIMVTSNGTTKSVLTSSVVDPDLASTPEPIKSVIVAGPADVTISAITNATLVLTYIKESELKATPTPTVTPIATVTPTATPTPTP